MGRSHPIPPPLRFSRCRPELLDQSAEVRTHHFRVRSNSKPRQGLEPWPPSYQDGVLAPLNYLGSAAISFKIFRVLLTTHGSASPPMCQSSATSLTSFN